MISKEHFLKSMKIFDSFMLERSKLYKIIEIISPTSTGIVEFADNFIDEYVNFISELVDDGEKWMEWFIFDNEMGKNGYKIIFDDKNYEINNSDDMYNFLCDYKNK